MALLVGLLLNALPVQAADDTEPEMVKIPNTNYAIGKYEVTQGQWKAVMGKNPSQFKDCGDTCPVEQVSWNDIQIFISKLNAKTGKNYRLPTESEWLEACQAGSQTKYCGSNDARAVAWHYWNSDFKTHPVGEKQANAYGLYDMSGNVAEWVQDKWSNEHDWRVLRGGSWYKFADHMLAKSSGYGDPAVGDYDQCGFRLARTLP